LPDSSEPVLVPTYMTTSPAAWNIWAFLLTAHSTALWLNPPLYKHLLSANFFPHSSAKILHFAGLTSIGAGPVYPVTVPTWAAVGSIGIAGGLEELAKAIPPTIFRAAFSTWHSPMWLSHFRRTVTHAERSSYMSLSMKESFISSPSPICRAFCKANRFQSKSAAITWYSA